MVGNDPRAATALVLLVLLSRIPFLGPRYGNIHDAWRVAMAAKQIARSGLRRFEISAAPGAGDHLLPGFERRLTRNEWIDRLV
jgi:hypothetical protein